MNDFRRGAVDLEFSPLNFRKRADRKKQGLSYPPKNKGAIARRTLLNGGRSFLEIVNQAT